MKLLTLLRHAKSSWQDASASDHERVLNARGEHDAPDMAKRLLQANCKPDKIICSTATRTQQTAHFMVSGLSLSAETVHLDDSLYLASAGTLLQLIAETDNSIDHLMVIAHNPGLEMLCRQLHPGAPAQMPTCAAMHVALHNQSFEVEADTEIELLFYDYPKSQSQPD